MALVKAQSGVVTVFKSLQLYQTTKVLPVTVLQVRFRKPKWLVPKRAPSKEGIYFHKPQPTEHDLEKTALAYKSYNAMLQSIVAAFQEKILLKEEKGKQESTVFDEEVHHAKCMAFNDAYNAEQRAEREKGLHEVLEKQEYDLKQKEQLIDREMRDKLKAYEGEVLEALKSHKDWVTFDNVEQKINEAMDNMVNFNFSVRRDGTIASRTVIP